MRQILAVIVLYRLTAEQSPAFCSLRELTSRSDPGVESIGLMLCDNSPGISGPPAGFPCTFLHDPTNPGLANHYNTALKAAAAAKTPWLMLLDQDTTLNAAYLNEVLAESSRVERQNEIVALVPQLVEAGVVLSPHQAVTLIVPKPLAATVSGVSLEKLHVYNSGAVLRVSALERIGGFPKAFPLDYLDHATFYLLRKDGGKLLILNAQLEHELSANQPERPFDADFVRRQNGVLQAEHRFYRSYGTVRQQLYCRIRLLRMAYWRIKTQAYGRGIFCLKLAFRP